MPRHLAAILLILASSPAFAGTPILYFSSYNDNQIFAADAAGTVTTFVSTGLNGPGGLAFDPLGNLYTANWNSGTISKISPTGSVSTYASGFSNPFALAFDPAGNLYVSNSGAGAGTTISKIAPNAASISTFASGLNQPMGLAFDNLGFLYAANNADGTIAKISDSGAVTPFASGLTHPLGLDIDSAGYLYASINLNTYAGTIAKISPAGIVSTFTPNAQKPYGLHLDTQDNLYLGTNIAPDNSAQILRFAPNASLTTLVPPPLGAATDVIPIPNFAFWNGSTGNWSDPTRWSTNPLAPNNGTPPTTQYDATISNGSVTLDTSPTLHSLTLSAGALIGTGNLTVYKAAIYGTFTLTGTTTLTGGTLVFGAASPIAGRVAGTGNLRINAGTTLTSDGILISGNWTITGRHNIRANAANAGTSKVYTLPTIASTTNGSTVTFTGTLNLADSKLIIESTDAPDKAAKLQALTAAIKSGSHGATWTGTGITSSAAAANAQRYGVGLFDNALLNRTSFAGQTADTNALLVTLAHIGDANDNGIVDIQDLTLVANNWQKPRNNWANGDLNLDGIVNIQDLTLVANNWQQTSSFPLSSSPFQSVPEPTALALLTMALAPLLLRKRR